MIKVVYFDDQSATDYLYIYNGGAKVQTSDKVKEKSGEIANKTSAGLFAKLSWLPFWGGEGATEIDTSLGHKSNSLIKTTLSNTVLTDFLDKIKEDNKRMLLEINEKFDDTIIGQDKVKDRLLAALYPLLQKSSKRKPIVLMFYGKSGVGKTETAKFISKVLGQPLFRKQFSMFHSGEFQGYLFGGTHSQASFARDLLERESNVLLLDEFDKPHPVFHSAFYQLFDEGIFEDKNYQLSLYNSIIICTSNYLTEEEIRKNLGDPIFYRFDKFIKFDDLSIEAICKIIDIQIENRCRKLSPGELKVIDSAYISEKMKAVANRIQNVRQIVKIVDEYISMQLVGALLKAETEKLDI